MRALALTALGFTFAAGSALAQSSYDYRDRDSRDNSYSRQSYDSDRNSRSGDWPDEDHHYARGHHHSRGASFYMKHGDKEFRVRCGGDESARECVDAAMTMFRQVQDASAMSPGSSSSTTGSTTSPGASGASPAPTTRQ